MVIARERSGGRILFRPPLDMLTPERQTVYSQNETCKVLNAAEGIISILCGLAIEGLLLTFLLLLVIVSGH